MNAAQRQGFTAIEILISISVMAILASISVPGLVESMHKGRINTAANAVTRVAGQARRLAIVRLPETGKRYGVLVVGGDQPYVALTYGADASPANVLMQDGKPVALERLSRQIEVLKAGTVVTGSAVASTWLYQPRSGAVVLTANPTAMPVNLNELTFRNRGGRYHQSIAE
jgi:prepilin-type N-terminal cleavage/methylation domain-containing protein